MQMPMFPLGRTLFPHAVLPVHVFEPRYLAMIDDCLVDDGRFGVILIERGSEVGGGDQRFGVGCASRIVGTAPLPDERLAVVAIGVERVRVTEWLPEEPYPKAIVEALPDPEPGEVQPMLDEAAATLRTVLGLYAELGIDTGDLSRLEVPAGNPIAATYRLCDAAPLGPLDAQRLLEADSTEGRLRLLLRLLDDTADMLRRHLAAG